MNKKIIALAIVCLSPVIFSWICYLYYDQIHFKPSNRGTLLNPPIELNDLLSQVKPKKWQIALALRNCNEANIDHILFQLSQLHKLLGKNQERVGLMLLLTHDCELKGAYSFTKIILSKQNNSKFQNALNKIRPEKSGNIYLIDPLSNAFMSYPATTDPMNIYKDLEIVLSVSQIG